MINDCMSVAHIPFSHAIRGSGHKYLQVALLRDGLLQVEFVHLVTIFRSHVQWCGLCEFGVHLTPFDEHRPVEVAREDDVWLQ